MTAAELLQKGRAEHGVTFEKKDEVFEDVIEYEYSESDEDRIINTCPGFSYMECPFRRILVSTKNNAKELNIMLTKVKKLESYNEIVIERGQLELMKEICPQSKSPVCLLRHLRQHNII